MAVARAIMFLYCPDALMSAKRAISIGNGLNSGTEVGTTPTMVYGGYSYCMLLYTFVYLMLIGFMNQQT